MLINFNFCQSDRSRYQYSFLNILLWKFSNTQKIKNCAVKTPISTWHQDSTVNILSLPTFYFFKFHINSKVEKNFSDYYIPIIDILLSSFYYTWLVTYQFIPFFKKLTYFLMHFTVNCNSSTLFPKYFSMYIVTIILWFFFLLA